MTDRELMQQALEALTAYDGTNGASQRKRVLAALRDRLAQPQVQPCAGRNCGSTNPNLHSAECFEDYEKSTGLAQPNDFNPDWDAMAVMVEEQQRMAKRIAELEAQPEQEPVALESVYETIIQWDEGGGKRSRRELARRIVDLYTAPPQRKPLTDEEINSLWDGHVVPVFGKNGINPIVFARSIEAKLKEKNA